MAAGLTRGQIAKMGSMIRVYRKESKISQAEFSRSLGISQGMLSRVEAGRMSPGLYPWIQFCAVSGQDPLSLLKMEKRGKAHG